MSLLPAPKLLWWQELVNLHINKRSAEGVRVRWRLISLNLFRKGHFNLKSFFQLLELELNHAFTSPDFGLRHSENNCFNSEHWSYKLSWFERSPALDDMSSQRHRMRSPPASLCWCCSELHLCQQPGISFTRTPLFSCLHLSFPCEKSSITLLVGGITLWLHQRSASLVQQPWPGWEQVSEPTADPQP